MTKHLGDRLCVLTLPLVPLMLTAALAVLASQAVDSAAAAGPASAPPQFSIHLMGFDDSQHTATWGFQRNRVWGVWDDGTSPVGLVGTSDRYSPLGPNAGESAWYFDVDDKSPRQIGLLGPEYYVAPYQSHRSTPHLINDAGQVAGTTSTDSTSSRGEDLGWFFDPATGTTTRIGYSALNQPSTRPSDLPRFLQNDGFVVGVSASSNHGAVHAWVYDPAVGVTQPIGLPANADIGPNYGQLLHTVEGVSDSNLVVGTSSRPSETSGNIAGPVAWVYSPQANVTKRIGLHGGAYTHPDGNQYSQFSSINGEGLVAGYSGFRVGGLFKSAAWLYDPIADTTRAIGFSNPTTGADWTDFVGELTEQNRVYGRSQNAESSVPWVYNHSNGITTTFGLTGGDHTLANGGSDNSIVDHSASGFVLGHARRGVGSTHGSYNRTPWVFNPTTGVTHVAGLTAGFYTSNGGGRFTSASQINESGQAIGASWLFYRGSPSTIDRESPWFFDSATGNTIELAKDLAISRQILWNAPRFLNNRGQVVGIAENNSGRGDFVWLYDHRTGTLVSDFDVRNSFTVRSDGEGASIAINRLTETGLVLGESERRTSSGSELGKTAWLYDSNTSTTYDLTFSQRSGGSAFTDVLHLADDGTMFGEYDAYSGSVYDGRRYFYWSIQHGFHDLESLIVGDLPAEGWAELFRGDTIYEKLDFVNDNLLVGSGLRVNGNHLRFALIRVPEPSAAAILVGASTCMGVFRNRRSFIG